MNITQFSVLGVFSRLQLLILKSVQTIRNVPTVFQEFREYLEIDEQARRDVDALFEMDYPTLLAERPDLAKVVRSAAQRKALERWTLSSTTCH
jgi:ABC-type enterochelin transport system substrate-binding protein